MLIAIAGWLVVGLIVGFIGSKMFNQHGDDPRPGIVIACVSALIAAILYTLISGAGVSSWNMWSLMWAAVGAIVGAGLWNVIRSRYADHSPYTRRRSY